MCFVAAAAVDHMGFGAGVALHTAAAAAALRTAGAVAAAAGRDWDAAAARMGLAAAARRGLTAAVPCLKACLAAGACLVAYLAAACLVAYPAASLASSLASSLAYQSSSLGTAWARRAAPARHRKACQAAGCPSELPFVAPFAHRGSTPAVRAATHHHTGSMVPQGLLLSVPSFASCWGLLQLTPPPRPPPHRPYLQCRSQTNPCHRAHSARE